jgi:hypothetical protein
MTRLLLALFLSACGHSEPELSARLVVQQGLLAEIKLFELNVYHREDRQGRILNCEDADRADWSASALVRRAGPTVFSDATNGDIAIIADGGDVLLTLVAYDSSEFPGRVVATACAVGQAARAGKTVAVDLVLRDESSP